MSKIVIFTTSQRGFWTREIGATVIKPDQDLLRNIKICQIAGISPILEVSEDSFWPEVISNLPKKSLILLLNSDEKYSLKFNYMITKFSSVSAVLRPYHLPKVSFSKLVRWSLVVLFNIREVKNKRRFVSYVRWILEGIKMALRQITIKIFYLVTHQKTLNICLGYTDLFELSFVEKISSTCEFEISEMENLIGNSRLRDFLSGFDRKFDLGFAGQEGQIVRKIAIEAGMAARNSNVIIRKTYGGVLDNDSKNLINGREYVELLLTSKNTLCPPGNISGNSFRITEAIVCGSNPLGLDSPISDPFFRFPFKSKIRFYRNLTWKKFLTRLNLSTITKNEDLLFNSIIEMRDELLKTTRFVSPE